MAPRQAKRPTAPEIRDRNTRDLLGRPGFAGLVRIGGASARGRGGGQSVLTNVVDDGPGSGVQGQLLVLSATGDSIASGGDYVTFDAEVYRHGFAEAIGADGQTITWPLSAVGSIQVEFAWDTYEGGGTIEIEVDGIVPDFGTIAEGTSGDRGSKRRGVHITAGAQVRIKVTQTSGSAQTADVLVEFQVQDPSADAVGLIETMWVDSKASSAVTSATTLQAGRPYRIVATGNWRLANPAYAYGTPDTILYPSSGEVAEQAGSDPEAIYADSAAGTFPRHDGNGAFRLDWAGGTPAHVEPDEGSVSALQPGHRYTYTVVGQGQPLSAVIFDTDYPDNNGQVKVEIWRGSP